MKLKNALGDFVMLIGGLVIAVLIVSFAFIIYNNQKETGNAVIAQSSRINNQLQESEWTQYDGVQITGSEVLNVIKRMKDSGTYVCVDNVYYCTSSDLATPDTPEEFSKKLKAAKSLSDDTAYIVPSALYDGIVDRTDNGAIKGITFTIAGAGTN